MLLNTPAKVQKKLTENTRRQRLEMDLTQEGLAKRSGVPLPTLRQFEQKHSMPSRQAPP
ncbi:MAG: helix-turn-helix transcriptional regulator [bacterium]|nr:helix-turn-helix transcriptional regulator [bacterium]